MKVKNPLYKRVPREFIGEIGKYLVIFLFMAATVGFVSGFLVADDSMLAAYHESFEVYQIENGNFTLTQEAGKETMEELAKKGVGIYPNFYVEEDTDSDLDGETESTLRIFRNREQVNRVCLMEGAFPEKEDEIAVDRMYADNNKILVGNVIKVGDKEFTVTGLVALSDYSALFSDNGDMMFDAVKFGVAVVTEEGFEKFSDVHLHYNYAWKYEEEPENVIDEKERAEEILEVLNIGGMLTGFLPRYLNQAICFTGDDMGSDRAMMITLLYIMIVIIAFVFAVTTSNTITKEAAVIGTLRASGYSRREMLVHYISLPLFVTLLAAVAGNLAGYTFFKDLCAGMYYGSYSLPTYVTRWNAQAFVLTTLVPFLIMLVVNIFLLYRKLMLSPLKFLRRDLSRTQKKKAVRLPKFRFLDRFRIRIVLQNKSGYLTLLVGIIFANLLLLFGMMMNPVLAHYQEQILDHMIADYQYILKMPVETETEGAEKYAFTSLETIENDDFKETVGIYGIIENSTYLAMEFPEDGVCISDVYADKYRLHVGDSITLKEKYSEKEYSFKVKGIFTYPSAISVFMPIEEFREIFEKEEDYYTGYFSDQEIGDIEEVYIASNITEEDLTKVSRQLDVSMGDMFLLVHAFAVALSALLLYLLTKLIIEKNTTSISMVKILGYENKEISSLYLTATTWVVVGSILISLFISTKVLEVIWRAIMGTFTGYLSFYVEPGIYPKMFLMGMGVYLVVALIQFGRIKKIPMEEALKNVE